MPARTNVMVTPDGRDTATQLVQRSPRSFRPWGGTGGTTQGVEALDAFTTAEVPVRWWQVTMIVDEVGNPALDLTNGLLGPPMVRGANSRIKAAVSDELWGSIVIVDTSKLQDTNWQQLTDYLSMVSLAQVKPDGAPAGHDSILNLFGTGQRPPGMTDMDRTYLRALYDMDTMLLPRVQRGIFASRMVREIRQAGEGN